MAIKYFPEPFRIKVVEPLRMLTAEERALVETIVERELRDRAHR